MLLQILQQTPDWFRTLCDGVEVIAYTSMLVPATLAFYRKGDLHGGMRTMAYLPAYLFGMFLLARAGAYFFRYNLPILHLSTIGETLLYSKIYYDEFTDTHIKQRIKAVLLFFAAFSIIDSLWLEGLQRINSYTNLAESTIVISLGLVFLDKNVIQKERTHIHLIPMFVATAGIIIYLSGTVLLYLTTNYYITLNDEYNARLMYLLGSALLLLLAMLLSRAFWLVRPAKAQLL
ncbi:hypothetical protein [Hymenobacter actinosclerus]|uniref:Uncharacterized protein n=1 Tax=Hymenobacter actinosclerus TaxID=82805 RepID=A0A1I0GNW8_9BACT|nr:hypothetical protein [Hymenobacter actinosclerus]SET72727.1 hypothetical protein SAMN04487998_2506 [Hymenobacter actinosclerus]